MTLPFVEQPEEKLSPPARLALHVGQYENSRIAREHSLHLNRCLRAIDGLRTFPDLPKQYTPPKDVDRRYTEFHRFGGKAF
jgi:hypothetical protein